MAPAAPSPGTGRLLRDRRLLGLLISGGLLILVVASVIGFSGAYFTSTSQSPGNEFGAAGMSLTLGVTGQVVAADGMLPGDTRSGGQDVTNTGHRGVLVLAAEGLDGSRLVRALKLKVVRDDGSTPVEEYNGPLTGMGALELGAMEQDEARHYTLSLIWPALNDSPELSQDSTSFAFAWRLESLP